MINNYNSTKQHKFSGTRQKISLMPVCAVLVKHALQLRASEACDLSHH